MEFRKIDEKKFQCRLLEEDLQNNNISLDDFFRNDTAKIHGLLDAVMEEAKESIGVDMDGNVMSLQLVPQPDHSILLTVSAGNEEFSKLAKDAGKDLDDFMDSDMKNNVIKNHSNVKKPAFTNFEKMSEIFRNDDQNDKDEETPFKDNKDAKSDKKDVANELTNEIAGADEVDYVAPKKKSKSKKATQFAKGVFTFETLEDFEEMCMNVSKTWGVDNSLWKFDDKYYFVISKGKCSKDKYVKLLNSVIEFGKLDCAGDQRVSYIKEHFQPIIKTNAINTAKRYL